MVFAMSVCASLGENLSHYIADLHASRRLNTASGRDTQEGVWWKTLSVGELEQLYRERYEHLVRVAASVTGDVETGRDAVQAAFAIAVRRRSTYRGGGSVEAWVWRIVVNEAKRLRRRAEPLLPLEPTSANGDGPDPDVRAWVAALPERQRTAVFLRYYADLEYREIAELLGIEVGTVSATLNAARAALRRTIEEVGR
jgi:DNA-directed RNA polymerase specialized sigma24 family protein